jgi:hypothetical protein
MMFLDYIMARKRPARTGNPDLWQQIQDPFFSNRNVFAIGLQPLSLITFLG